MKKINLNGKEYQIPTDWSQVTLRMQMKIQEDYGKITIPEMQKFALLSGYAGIPIDELKKAKITEITELFKHIGFVNEEIPEKPIAEFDFNGKHYYAGQNLIETEFQDFISIENTLEEYSGNTYNALPTILAIMCKQKKENGLLESLDDYDVKKRSEEFKDLPLTIAHQLSLFFSLSTGIYSNLFQSYSKPEVQKELLEMKIESVKNTLQELDGKGWLTRCVAGMLRIYLKSIKRQLDKHFTSIQ